MIQIELPNIPIAWAVSTITKRGAFDPRRKEKEFTRWQIKSQHRGEPLKGFYVLDILCIFPIPNSATKSEKERMLKGEDFPTSCDNTNLQKLYEDCLKKIVITDDRYVVDNHTRKIYGEKEKVIIKVNRSQMASKKKLKKVDPEKQMLDFLETNKKVVEMSCDLLKKIEVMIKKCESHFIDCNKILKSQDEYMKQNNHLHKMVDESLGNMLLAIKQNIFLQAWFPEQLGFPEMKVTGRHPAKTASANLK